MLMFGASLHVTYGPVVGFRWAVGEVTNQLILGPTQTHSQLLLEKKNLCEFVCVLFARFVLLSSCCCQNKSRAQFFLPVSAFHVH